MNRFILFTAPWCAACTELKPQIASMASGVGVSIEEQNYDEPEVKALAAKHGVRGLPSLLILSPSGDRLSRTPGKLVTTALLGRFAP